MHAGGVWFCLNVQLYGHTRPFPDGRGPHGYGIRLNLKNRRNETIDRLHTSLEISERTGLPAKGKNVTRCGLNRFSFLLARLPAMVLSMAVACSGLSFPSRLRGSGGFSPLFLTSIRACIRKVLFSRLLIQTYSFLKCQLLCRIAEVHLTVA